MGRTGPIRRPRGWPPSQPWGPRPCPGPGQPWNRGWAALPPGPRGALLAGAAPALAPLGAAAPAGALRQALARRPGLPAVSVTGRAPIRFFRAGRHAHRMPLAYSHLAPLWATPPPRWPILTPPI